jgi:hypothetical protein
VSAVNNFLRWSLISFSLTIVSVCNATQFEVAHIREQGQDMIVIPVNLTVVSDKSQIYNALQICARSAGLAGSVVMIWKTAEGRIQYIAPSQWHRFVSQIDRNWIVKRLNKRINCAD